MFPPTLTPPHHRDSHLGHGFLRERGRLFVKKQAEESWREKLVKETSSAQSFIGTVKPRISAVWLKGQTHPNGFEEVQVGQEVALGLVKPIAGGIADTFLNLTGHVVISNVDKFLQGRFVTEVSEMEAKTFSQHLDGKNWQSGSERVQYYDHMCARYNERVEVERNVSKYKIYSLFSFGTNANVTT